MTSKYPLIPSLEIDIARFVSTYGDKPVKEICEHFLKYFPQYRGFSMFEFEDQVQRAYDLNHLKTGKDVGKKKKDISLEALQKLRDDIEKTDVDKLISGDELLTSGPMEVTKKIHGESVDIKIPHVSLNEVLGLDSTLKKIENTICLTLFKLEIKALILSGPLGCGKGMIAEGIASKCKAGILRYNLGCLGMPRKKRLKFMKALFIFAEEYAPTVMVFTKTLFENYSDSNESLAMTFQLLSCMEDIRKRNAEVFVIITTTKPEDIPIHLSNFVPEVYIPFLDINGRYEVLKMVIKKNESYNVDFDLKEIALKTPSYTAFDLQNVIRDIMSEACIKYCERFCENLESNNYIGDPLKHYMNHIKFDRPMMTATKEHFLTIMESFKSMAMFSGFPSIPELTFDSIGGMENLKEEIYRKFIKPIMHQDLYSGISILKRPSGLLLWGPPGCGKTMLATAMASRAGINFLAVSGPELLNMYQGESEKNVRKVFSRAFNAAPCIIFFDEFDALCQGRTRASERSNKTSILTSFLTALDGMNTRTGVYLIAATNRPDTLDQAVLRPGRFETVVYVGLPELSERILLLKTCLKGFKYQLNDTDLEELARKMNNFSPADINCLCNEADEVSYIIAEQKDGRNVGLNQTILYEHFLTALKTRRPSVSQGELRKYEQLRKKY